MGKTFRKAGYKECVDFKPKKVKRLGSRNTDSIVVDGTFCTYTESYGFNYKRYRNRQLRQINKRIDNSND